MAQPEPPLLSAATEATNYIRSWADQLDQVDVRGVFGYCSGGALACGLAAELGRRGHRPPTLLVDPFPATGDTLYHQFTEASAQLATMVDGETLAAATAAARAVCVEPGLARAGRELPKAFAELARRALSTVDDEDVVDELCDGFETYVNYLMAAHWLGYRDSAVDTAAVFSSDYAPPPDYVGKSLTIAVPHTRLFLTDGLVDAVHELYAIGVSD